MSWIKQRRVTLLFLLILLVSIASIAYRTNQLKRLVKVQQLVINAEQKESEQVYKQLKSVIDGSQLNYSFTGNAIDNWLLTTYDGSGIIKTNLKEIIKGYSLILTINENSCQKCINEQIEFFREIEQTLSIEDLLIIYQVSNNRKLKSIIDHHGLKTRIVRVEQPSHQLNVLSINPSAMIVDNKLRILSFFRPLESNIKYNRDCYYSMLNNFFVTGF